MDESIDLALLVEAIDVPVAIVDASGRLTIANRPFARLLDYRDPCELHGLLMSSLADDTPEEPRDVAFVARSGSTVWGHTTIAGLAEGSSMWIVVDVTKRRREGAPMPTPTGEVGQLASVFAHELKNPLAGIRGALEIVGERLPPAAPEQQILAAIVHRIGELNALIDGILHFARPVTPRFERVSISGCLRRAREHVQSTLDASNVTVAIQGDDLELDADPKLLEILFCNLLLNGAQASTQGGEIRVQSSRGDGGARVVVMDDGPGIPDHLRERVLEPFFTTRARGAGLGLPTARHIARAHGGELSIRDLPGGGTAVEVTLPDTGDLANV